MLVVVIRWTLVTLVVLLLVKVSLVEVTLVSSRFRISVVVYVTDAVVVVAYRHQVVACLRRVVAFRRQLPSVDHRGHW